MAQQPWKKSEIKKWLHYSLKIKKKKSNRPPLQRGSSEKIDEDFLRHQKDSPVRGAEIWFLQKGGGGERRGVHPAKAVRKRKKISFGWRATWDFSKNRVLVALLHKRNFGLMNYCGSS